MLVFRGCGGLGECISAELPGQAGHASAALPSSTPSCYYPHLLLPRLACTILTWTSDLGVRECRPDGQEPKHETTASSGHLHLRGLGACPDTRVAQGNSPKSLQEPKAQLNFFLELRCNLHTLKLYLLKYTIQWLLICSQVVQPSP